MKFLTLGFMDISVRYSTFSNKWEETGVFMRARRVSPCFKACVKQGMCKTRGSFDSISDVVEREARETCVFL